jgi:hypothetical protein
MQPVRRQSVDSGLLPTAEAVAAKAMAARSEDVLA